MVYDPAQREQENSRLNQYLTERLAFKQILTPKTKESMSALIRTHPTLSANVVTAVGLSGVDWEGQPWLEDLAMRDQVTQDTSIMSKIRGVTRGGLLVAESLWQASAVSHGLRTATLMNQGKSFEDAYKQAGASWLGRVSREWAKGNPVNIGNGWLPQSTDPLEQPGIGAVIDKAVNEQGMAYDDAVELGRQWSVTQHGTPITQTYDKVAESTLLAKTVNGQTRYSPVSLGRVAAISVFDPGTVPFQVSSALVDGFARVSGLDPVDVPIKEFGLWRAAKNNIVPQEAAHNIRQLERTYLEEKLDIVGNDLPEGIGGMTYGQRAAVPSDVVARNKLAADEYRELRGDFDLPRYIELDYVKIDSARGTSPGTRPSRKGAVETDAPFDPYGAAYDELDRIAQEKYGMNYDEYLYTQYGDYGVQKFDELLHHELVHSEQFDADLIRRANDGDKEAIKALKDEGAYVPLGSEGPRREFVERADELRTKAPEVNRTVAETKGTQRQLEQELAAAQRSKADKWENMSRAERQAEQKNIKGIEDQLDEAVEAHNAALKQRAALDDEIREIDTLVNNAQFSEYDAVYQTGLKLMAGESEAAVIRKRVLREAGVTSSWRPWLKPQLVEDYLTSSRGRHTIQWLAKNQDLAKQRKVLNHGLPAWVQKNIAKATTEAEVIAHLAPYLGKQVAGAPLASKAARVRHAYLEARGLPSDAASIMRFRGGIMDRVSTSAHRFGAKSVKLELNPYDIEQTLDHATAWMRTIRATDSEVNDMLYKIIDAANKPNPSMDGIYDELTDMFIRKFNEGLEGKNLSVEQHRRLLTDVIRDWRKAVLDNKEFQIDAVGNKVTDVDRQFAEMYLDARGANAPVPRYSAVLEAQTSMTQIALPNVHQVRQATSRLHLSTQTLIEKVMSSKALKGEGFTYQTLETLFPGGLQSSFGIGFLDGVHKVWRDMALLRIGWPLRVLPEEMVRQAAAGYSDMMTHPVNYVALMMRKHMAGDVMGNTLDDVLTLDKLGSGQFRALDLQYDATKQAWTIVHPGNEAYAAGLANEILQLATDEISARVARNGIEDTLLWMETDEGAEVVRRVTAKGSASGPIDLATAEARQLYVERAAALHAQYTGGEWVRQTADGKWWDMAGQEIRPWSNYTRAELHAKINAVRAENGKAPLTAQPNSYGKQHWIDTAIEETGIPNLSTADQTYIVTRQGNDQLRRLIGTGELEDGTRVIYPEMKRRSRHEWDIEDFTNSVEGYFKDLDVPQPVAVRVPRNALQKGADKYNAVVDTVFESLMAKPSAYLVRSPFFRQVYSEEMARWYIFGDAALRRHLKGWAADNGVTRMFNRHVREATAKAGMKKLPPGSAGIGTDSLEQIDLISRQRGLQKTRDLFYDLAERHNITDMTKYIFPFADAWFEVLSRWAKLMFTDSQNSLKNWRRMQVGVMNARKSGFFSEDANGREVFNWPGAGLMAPWFANTPDNTRMDSKIGLDQLMFIDPNPRGLMMPGVGPIIQIPASGVQPLLEGMPTLQDAINYAAFGDFESIEPQTTGELFKSFLPSWVKQTLTAFMADENKAEFADEIGRWYEVLLMSNSPAFGDESKDRMNATLKQARKTGTALSFLKIMDRFIQPATPRYEAAIDASIDNEDPFWMTALGLEREWSAAQRFFDDSDMAREYFVSRFGLDPLNLHPSTYRVQDAPSTENAYEFLRSNQELYELTPNSMMAWIDVPEDDEFFYPAYQRQQAEGQRHKLTPEQRAWAINEQTAWHEYNQAKKTYDDNRAQVLANTEERSPQRKRMLEVLNQWRRRRKHEIFETYFAWDNQQGRENVKLPTRPDTLLIWDEFAQAGTPGTQTYDFTRGLDEGMSDFMVNFNQHLRLARQTWLNYGDQDGWITSTRQEAKAVRQGFIDQINLNLMRLPLSSKERGRYVVDRYIMPAFEDFEMDDDLFVKASEVEQPAVPDWADTVQPTGPGAELVGANTNG